MNKFSSPIRTSIVWNHFEDSSMTIIGETEKAYLFIVSQLVRKGTSKVLERIEQEKWIPKSVWNNENNFKTYLKGGDSGVEITSFISPYFLK